MVLWTEHHVHHLRGDYRPLEAAFGLCLDHVDLYEYWEGNAPSRSCVVRKTFPVGRAQPVDVVRQVAVHDLAEHPVVPVERLWSVDCSLQALSRPEAYPLPLTATR